MADDSAERIKVQNGERAVKSRKRRYATHWSATPLVHILRPMQEFIHQSQAGGIVLLAMTVLALAIANSPLRQGYEALLETHISLHVGAWVLEESVLHWVNDGLMVIFFFVVGLEIKREIIVGELSNVRAAALPIVAAIGGVVAPALVYTAFNFGHSSVHGWGVPTATDIAFALGCLALLGNRVPFGIKVFLTAVAIVDDLIAVLVIAIFYSSDLNFTMLGIGFGIILLLLLANISGFQHPLIYGGLGIVVWLAFLNSGVHATIAGVLVALTIPARSRIDVPTFLARTRQIISQMESTMAGAQSKRSAEFQQSAVLELEEISEQVQAPLQKMEHELHSWVTFVIMPVFALANAGVAISPESIGSESMPVMLGVILGLTMGKPIGIVGASWLAVRAGIGTLPSGATWRHMLATGVLAGIGFTMSIFIASLAFGDVAMLATAKISILIASALAGSVGILLLSRVPAQESRRPE
jgi:NhaA family Na+:H+ antiporter